MGVGKDMPRVAGRYFWEEVIGIADENWRSVLWHLRVKEDLRSLRHARYRFHAEVSQCRNGPGIEVGSDEFPSIFGKLEGVEHELGTVTMSTESQMRDICLLSFHSVDSTR